MRRITIVTLTFLFLLAAADIAAAQTGRELFQQALVKERANGDFRGAIEIYERIVREFAADRSLTASALVQLGQCYEKLGSAEAERAYQRVVSEFADQGEFAARARVRLAALTVAAGAAGAPVAQRLLSYLDTDINEFIDMAPAPDGRRMAHINYSNGGVYVRDLASGWDERVIVGEPDAWYTYPRWSPDGRRLAAGFNHTRTSGGAVRVIDVVSHKVFDVPGTETEERTTVQGWSPDGRRLLCGRGNRVVLIAIEDGTVTVVADSVPWGEAALSPDGRFVAYAKGAEGREQIFVKSVSGGAPRQVTDGSAGNWNPVWSPAGAAIAYNRSDGIWVVPMTDGSVNGAPRLAYPTRIRRSLNGWTEAGGLYVTLRNAVTLAYRIPVDPATGGSGSGAAEVLPNHPDDLTNAIFVWSPDMQQVAFGWYYGSTISIHAADGRVSTYDVATGASLANLWWSGDGREIHFVSWKGQSASYSLALSALDPATGRVRELHPWSNSWQVFSVSAGGSRVVVVRRDGVVRRSFAVADSGLQNVRVVAPAFDAEGVPLSNWVRPQMSPPGDRVLFGRQAGGDSSPDAETLWIVDTDGAGARRLASVRNIWSAVWDPTGRFIAYTGTVDSATTVLRVVEVATGAQHDLPLPNTGVRPATDPGGAYRAVTWSPDGKFVGIVMGQARYEFWALKGLQEGER